MPRIQIHLSTALVLMLATGMLMWLNTRPTRNIIRTHSESRGVVLMPYMNYGWPGDAVWRTDEPDFPTTWGWNAFAVIIDAGIGMLMLLSLWFVCELRIYPRVGDNARHPFAEREASM